MKRTLLSAALVLFAVLGAKSQIVVSGNITANTTWTKDNIYILNGWVYVKNNATLTIQPGTLIKGDFNSKGALIIERGSKIMAVGTEQEPIVFTSQKPVGQRNFGDWGGLIVCGKASINVPGDTAIIEGGVGSVYGGGAAPDDGDNSGVIQYVRIEYGGIPFQPNSEINGLTCGGVGSGTTIDHVQVSYSGDDAFEFFGGTVNAKYLIAYGNWDDDFDTDFGFRGKIQFAISLRDPAFADQSGSNGFESDNDGTGSGNTPITKPIFSNVTVIGPLANGTANALYRRGLHLRRNTRTNVFNSVFVGYPTGLFIESTTTQANATSGELNFRNNVLAQMTDTLAAQSNGSNVNGAFNLTTWFNTPAFANALANNVTDLGIVDWSLIDPDLRLTGGSILNAGADFTYANLQGGFFTTTTYRGAFGSTDWTTCWAEWNPQQEPYLAATNNTIVAAITPNGATTICQGESVTLEATAGSSYLWSNGATTQSITVSASGTFTVQVWNSNRCTDVSDPLTVTVNALPNATITPSGSTTFCTGSSVTLTAASSASYLWSTGDITQSIVVTTTGSFQVTVTDGNGCSNESQIVTTSVSNAPAPTIGVGGGTTFCDGGSVVLTSSSADTYNWSNGATTQAITVTSSGSYTVTVTNTDPCNGTGPSDPVDVTVNPLPVVNFTKSVSGGTVDFTNNSTGGMSYLWDFGDGLLSNQEDASHTYTANGTYTVCLTVTTSDGCVDSMCQTLTLSAVGLEDPRDVLSALSVYPNPANAVATVQFSTETASELVITLHDVLGRVVMNLGSGSFAPGDHTVMADLTALDQGIYFVMISGDGQRLLKQLAVAR